MGVMLPQAKEPPEPGDRPGADASPAPSGRARPRRHPALRLVSRRQSVNQAAEPRGLRYLEAPAHGYTLPTSSQPHSQTEESGANGERPEAAQLGAGGAQSGPGRAPLPREPEGGRPSRSPGVDCRRSEPGPTLTHGVSDGERDHLPSLYPHN